MRPFPSPWRSFSRDSFGSPFQIHSRYGRKCAQPRAIAELTQGHARNDRFQTLLGATGTGKTYTMAHVIANHGRPTLVEKLRLRATSALMEREDVVIVASISCIYGLGNPRVIRSVAEGLGWGTVCMLEA